MLAPPYVNAMGMSTVESFDLTDDQGNPIQVLDGVLDAVAQTAPEALAIDPNLHKELSVDFAHDRSHIHVGDMWSRRGYERSYKVLASAETGRAEKVTVRARLVPKDGAAPHQATLIGHTNEAGNIKQLYKYADLTETESYHGSYAVGVASAPKAMARAAASARGRIVAAPSPAAATSRAPGCSGWGCSGP